MAEFTLLEVHLEDASFSVNAPFVGGADEAGEAATEDSDGGGLPLVPLLALVVLAVAAVAAKRSLGSEAVDIE